MEKMIDALMDSGYELVACRDHLYTFACGHITVVVNTYTLTGGYVISVNADNNDFQKYKYHKITSIVELKAFIKACKRQPKTFQKR